MTNWRFFDCWIKDSASLIAFHNYTQTHMENCSTIRDRVKVNIDTKNDRKWLSTILRCMAMMNPLKAPSLLTQSPTDDVAAPLASPADSVDGLLESLVDSVDAALLPVSAAGNNAELSTVSVTSLLLTPLLTPCRHKPSRCTPVLPCRSCWWFWGVWLSASSTPFTGCCCSDVSVSVSEALAPAPPALLSTTQSTDGLAAGRQPINQSIDR